MAINRRLPGWYLGLFLFSFACVQPPKSKFTGAKNEIKFVALDPGPSHAALIQKYNYPVADSNVYVYTPGRPELAQYLQLINHYNTRRSFPTNWNEIIVTDSAFLKKMLHDKPGNVVLIVGINDLKKVYISKCVGAGLNVLADNPLVIDTDGFDSLRNDFILAGKKRVLLYEIMPERFEITSELRRAFMMDKAIFGTLRKGSAGNPAVTFDCTHFLNTYVSGRPLVRPAWFFDPKQQGNGLVDAVSRLVDLVQWECFPDEVINYESEIDVYGAKHWVTDVSPDQFREITQSRSYPIFLRQYVSDSVLRAPVNSEIDYRIKGVHARVSVQWYYNSTEIYNEPCFSIMCGTKCNLVVRQDSVQQYKKVLFIQPAKGVDTASYSKMLVQKMKTWQSKIKGLAVKKVRDEWKVMIPDSFQTSNEARFGLVAEQYFKYLQQGKLPDWEIPAMLAKYYVTTKALELSRKP